MGVERGCVLSLFGSALEGPEACRDGGGGAESACPEAATTVPGHVCGPRTGALTLPLPISRKKIFSFYCSSFPPISFFH